MTGPTEKGGSQKIHILKTATSLFARKGYAATGVREIAREADVNLAMINYYFDSKAGLLKAIIMDFFSNYKIMLDEMFNQDHPPQTLEDVIGSFVPKLVKLCRENRDQVRVTMTELPIEIPEIADFKANQLTDVLGTILPQMIPIAEKESSLPLRKEILGPALAGMVIFHFLHQPVIEKLFGVTTDDAFYEDLSKTIVHVYLNGVRDHKFLPNKEGEK